MMMNSKVSSVRCEECSVKCEEKYKKKNNKPKKKGNEILSSPLSRFIHIHFFSLFACLPCTPSLPCTRTSLTSIPFLALVLGTRSELFFYLLCPPSHLTLHTQIHICPYLYCPPSHCILTAFCTPTPKSRPTEPRFPPFPSSLLCHLIPPSCTLQGRNFFFFVFPSPVLPYLTLPLGWWKIKKAK